MPHFGLQLPSFTFPGVPDAGLFDRVAAIAGAAEDAGFDSFWVMDHYHQIPNIGPPSEPMLEAYTVLSGVAARTSRISLGALVTGVTYRNPAFLAKVVTTLDIVSSGRAILGIGPRGTMQSLMPMATTSRGRPSDSTASRTRCRSAGRCSDSHRAPSTGRSRAWTVPGTCRNRSSPADRRS
ncbi:MAG TPA: LLM class flavin-dependent oxidoreductase [Actinomycetota bacterium]